MTGSILSSSSRSAKEITSTPKVKKVPPRKRSMRNSWPESDGHAVRYGGARSRGVCKEKEVVMSQVRVSLYAASAIPCLVSARKEPFCSIICDNTRSKIWYVPTYPCSFLFDKVLSWVHSCVRLLCHHLHNMYRVSLKGLYVVARMLQAS